MSWTAQSLVPEREACPRCEYSLAGLPDEHRCPECGFAYRRRRMRAIRQSRRYSNLYLFMALLGGTGTVLALVIPGEREWLAILFFGGFTVDLLRRAQFGRSNRALLNDWGFSLIGKQGMVKELAWRRVGSVTYEWNGGTATVRSPKGRTVHVIQPEFLGSEQNMRAFAAAAEEYLAKHRADGEWLGSGMEQAGSSGGHDD